MDSEIQWYITFRLPDLPPDMTVVRGHDQVRELWNAFRSVWEQVTVEVVEVLEQSDDVLVCKVRFRGQGSASGVEVDRILYYVFEMSAEEMLKRIQPFDDPDEALRAAGMGRKDH